MINRLSIQLSEKNVSEFSPELKLPENLICSDRIRPRDTVNIWMNGEVREAKWGLIPSSAVNDLQQHNRIGILCKDLGNSTTYRLIARKKRGFMFISAFYNNTIVGGIRSRHKIKAVNNAIMAIPLVYDEWRDPDDQMLYTTFSILHHKIQSEDSRLPRHIPMLLENREQVQQWMDLDKGPHRVEWPDFDPTLFHIGSKEMDVKMHPAFDPIFPSNNLPEHLKNIA